MPPPQSGKTAAVREADNACKKSSAKTAACTVPQDPRSQREVAHRCLSLARSDVYWVSVEGTMESPGRTILEWVFIILGSFEWRIANVEVEDRLRCCFDWTGEGAVVLLEAIPDLCSSSWLLSPCAASSMQVLVVLSRLVLQRIPFFSPAKHYHTG